MIESLITQASSYARDIDDLFTLITWIVGVWFFAAEIMFFWLIFRFRAKEGVPAQYITGGEKHLHRWITIPHNMILVLDIIIIIAAVRVWVHIKQTLPPADRTIKVMSQQWAWTFTDPGADNKLETADDIRTTDELHLEVGKTYHFLLESKDVLHSFFIPAFRFKHDAVPGRIHTGWFKPTKVGDYDILCAEICGIAHGVMGAKLQVESAAAHAKWVEEHTPAEALAAVTSPPAEGAPTAGTTTETTPAAAGSQH